MFRVRALLLALFAFGCLPASALASEVVQLHVRFLPFKLGVSTTVETSFEIGTNNGQAPSPLINVSLRLPEGMDFTSTNLGVETCTPPKELTSFEGCSPNSIMGHGKAVVEVPVHPEPVFLTAYLTEFMGVPANHHTTILVYAETTEPVFAQFIYTGELLKASAPFGGDLNTSIPLTTGLPGGPNIPVVHMQSTLGPLGITYYTRVHHKRVGYNPTGLVIPTTCPHGGFPYEGIFSFEDGTQVAAKATVPCRNKSRSHGA